MKVMIVDDDYFRAQKIDQLVKRLCGATASTVIESCTANAERALRSQYYDVLILDVVLPHREGEEVAAHYGLGFLDKIFQYHSINKPEKIIGITAYIRDIERFRERFERKCFVVIEVSGSKRDWEESLGTALNHTVQSKVSRVVKESDAVVISVHGIRTFGSWQKRLKSIVSRHIGGFSFHNYKYGYFSVFSFFVPFLRKREVRLLKQHILSVLEEDNVVYFFSHSFGTYLVAHAVRDILSEGRRPKIRKIVLAGSVLKRNFDWGFLKQIDDCQVVNECGDSDYILLFSEALVLGTGMAGKVGFKGFDNDKLVNRFFSGGHGLYFDGDQHMERNWVSVFSEECGLDSYDERKESFFHQEILDQFAIFFGCFKYVVYLFLVFMVWWLFK